MTSLSGFRIIRSASSRASFHWFCAVRDGRQAAEGDEVVGPAGQEAFVDLGRSIELLCVQECEGPGVLVVWRERSGLPVVLFGLGGLAEPREARAAIRAASGSPGWRSSCSRLARRASDHWRWA